jgi:hypothetical protein
MRLPPTLWAIYKDYWRYCATVQNQDSLLGVVLLIQGFWASCVYRIAHDLHQRTLPPSIKRLLSILLLLWKKAIEGYGPLRSLAYQQHEGEPDSEVS